MNNLSKSQIERLALLLEECAEVQHIIGKILRHGYDSSHKDYNNIKNKDLFRKELIDLHLALNLTFQSDDVENGFSEEEIYERLERKNQYLKYNKIKYEID